MKNCCDLPQTKKPTVDPVYRRILWVALLLNATMFCAEFAASFLADSISLQADSIDFLGDAVNYGVSLYVLSSSIRTRAWASIVKGSTMGLFGFWVIIEVGSHMLTGAAPQPSVMTTMGFLALAVNVSVAFMLFKYRDGDSNMTSVWLCSRNDAIGNIAVVLAAGGVHYTSTMWPDLVVAFGMGSLSIHSSYLILKKAKTELKLRTT